MGHCACRFSAEVPSLRCTWGAFYVTNIACIWKKNKAKGHSSFSDLEQNSLSLYTHTHLHACTQPQADVLSLNNILTFLLSFKRWYWFEPRVSMAYLVLSLLFPTVQAYAKCLVSYTNLTIAKTNSRLHLSISGIIKLLLRKREQTPEVSYICPWIGAVIWIPTTGDGNGYLWVGFETIRTWTWTLTQNYYPCPTRNPMDMHFWYPNPKLTGFWLSIP